MSEIRNNSIKNWAEDDRPREKMILKGESALSNAELLAILISTGTKEASALQLSQSLLEIVDNNMHELGKLKLTDITKIKGIGSAKAVTIMAALELGRRRLSSEVVEKKKINSSTDAFNFFWPLIGDLPHEEFWVLFVNRSNLITRHHLVSRGGLTATIIDTRKILSMALDCSASGMIVAHNHPSGNKTPSDADKQITQRIKQAGELFSVNLLDHLIIAEKKYFSFADEGLI